MIGDITDITILSYVRFVRQYYIKHTHVNQCIESITGKDFQNNKLKWIG